MLINIYTPDSRIPNLAAMKIASYHKQLGDKVTLNFPLIKADLSYASVLFQWTPDPIDRLTGLRRRRRRITFIHPEFGRQLVV